MATSACTLPWKTPLNITHKHARQTICIHRLKILQIHLKPSSQKMESASFQLERISQSGEWQHRDSSFDSLEGGWIIDYRVVSCRNERRSSPGIPERRFSRLVGGWRNLWETGSCDRPAGTIYCLANPNSHGSSALGPRESAGSICLAL
jgi:hypothetical protein